MKRLSSGMKRKKAAPARSRVAKISKEKKAVTTRKVAKKAAPVRRKTKSPQAKKVAQRRLKAVKTAKAKPVKKPALRKKPAPSVVRAAAKRSVKRKISPAVAVVPASRKTPTKLPSRTTTVKPVSARQSKTLLRVDRRSARPAVAVPAFLLEGDEPSVHASGSGEKFYLDPTPPLDHFDEANAPLPESYGTGKIYLTVRDPHWLYANWDFTREEQFRHNAASVDRHLVLRVHSAPQTHAPIAEYHVHPESKYWFIHVDRAGETYSTELGYYAAGRKWKSLGFSTPQRTPPDHMSKDSTVKFATIPMELSFDTMLQLLREADDGSLKQPLAHVVDQLRPLVKEFFPHESCVSWSLENNAALAAILAADGAHNTLPNSGEFVADNSLTEFLVDWPAHEGSPLNVASSYVSSYLGGS